MPPRTRRTLNTGPGSHVPRCCLTEERLRAIVFEAVTQALKERP